MLRTYEDGQVVVGATQRRGLVGLIATGMVKVSACRPGLAGGDAPPAMLDIRGAGELIGLVECCSGRTTRSEVTALGAAAIRVMQCSELQQLLDRHPDAARAAMQVLAERVERGVAARVRAGWTVPARLAESLLALADEHGVVGEDGSVTVELQISQQELAGLIDASRDAVAKTLMLWRRIGLVRTNRCTVSILDSDRLIAMVR